MSKLTYIFSFAVLLSWLSTSYAQDIQRVRINFHSPANLNRELLLGFTPNNEATDGFDYGYDGMTADDFPDDLNWLIEGQRCVIQGVGIFDVSKQYPFWLGLTNSGTSTISLITLENFEEPIDVYIYDSLNETYTLINDSPLDLELIPDEYSARYYIAFQDPEENNGSLSLDTIHENQVELSYLKDSERLKIHSKPGTIIKSVSVYNTLGQKILTFKESDIQESTIRISSSKSQVLLVEIQTNLGVLVKRILI
ncbi:MAG: T9SS type A sorting domain-containing protein [Flavobacteriaceae bacterium]|nr:T9SS type A sorting domain-containing protein [Flavobacteriaceae bacterium]